MIRHRLVDEAPARGIDGDQTGLGAVKRQMRIGAAPAGEPPGLGHRRPARRLRMVVLDGYRRKFATDSKARASGSMSSRPIIMPPSAMNSPIGARSLAKSAPSSRPSNGSGASARPANVVPGRFDR